MKHSNSEMENILQIVSFTIENEEFGIDILKVEEIIRILNITKIPNSPEFIEGFVNLRGKVIPIVNLRKRLKINPKEFDNQTRVIVVNINNFTVGFIVDRVREVLRIPSSITEPTPYLTRSVKSEYITGVAKLENRLLILLDLEKILSLEEKEELSKVSNEEIEALN